ncbi:hypothetical protein KW790_02435 [Candidatus Parcubacteria bacterium]|nr:hypothetical protein [Candidatus Parcubacteria bacterium]
MQTYTHGVLGALAGAVFFPHEPTVQIACIMGSMAPDGFTFVKYALDKMQGRPPFSNWSRLPWFIEATHSFVVGAILVILALLSGTWAIPSVRGFLLSAIFLHVLVDVFTHIAPEYKDTDATYLWPLPGSLRPSFGWEYRRPKVNGGHNIKLKPVEGMIIAIALVVTIVIYLH